VSENWIRLISVDPQYIPDLFQQKRAIKELAIIAPEADITVQLYDTIQLFDCGGNFERVLCPSCKTEVSVDWWAERLNEDYENGFKLATYVLPCCNARCTFNEMVYEWPQAFGKFSLEARNPNIGMLNEKDKNVLEEILGTSLIVVYQHL
jgi:hypothetical protein